MTRRTELLMAAADALESGDDPFGGQVFPGRARSDFGRVHESGPGSWRSARGSLRVAWGSPRVARGKLPRS